jgi:predicted branched-subunit amino acid permease
MSASLLALDQMGRGARACLVPGLAVLVFSFVMGALAHQANWTLPYIVSFCLGVAGASVQAIALQMWGSPADLVPILVAGFAVHLRYALIAASLRNILAEVPFPRKALALHMTSDSSWAMTIADERRNKGTSPAFLFGGSLVIMGCYTLGNVGGYFAALSIAEVKRYGLDFAILGVFLCLLIALWRSARADLLPWGVAALASSLARHAVSGGWYMVLGAIAGALAAGAMTVHGRAKARAAAAAAAEKTS